MAARPGAARSSTPPRGRRSRSGWPSGPSSSTRSSPTCTPTQRLLRDGLLPPAVVLGHGGFTRVVARASSRDPRPLVFSATDLGRDADGPVAGARPTAPRRRPASATRWRTGGWSRGCMPELYREAGLHRMEPYFWALRSALLQSAQGDLADPRVVVLSPGHALGDGVRPGVRRQRPRLPAGPGQRPRRPRRLGLDAVAVGRAGAGRRDPAPGRRGVERPARAARRVPARRGGPDRGRTPRPGAHRQRARRRGASRTPACCPSCRRSARSCSASSCAWSRCRPGGAATRARSSRSSTGSTTSQVRTIDGPASSPGRAWRG